MTTETLATSEGALVLERVVTSGDLSQLTPLERVAYYRAVCESVGLNPLTRPLEYINLNGKLTLYATRAATDQIRKLHRVSITRLEESKYGDLYLVTAYAHDGDGRTDCAKGAVNLSGLRGQDMANAMMKAETKAKRRVTLSLCGLGVLDETETEEGLLPVTVRETVVEGALATPVLTPPDRQEPMQQTFITAEDDERKALIVKIQQTIKARKMSTVAVGRLKETFLGQQDADPLKADVAALAALLKHLEGAK